MRMVLNICTKPYKNIENWDKDVEIKIVNHQKPLQQGVGLIVAQGWTGIRIDMHRARRA
jgi:hypothetical protein